MNRSITLFGALALAVPALAFSQRTPAPADASNPAAAPLSPSLDRTNQPARGEDSQIVRDAEAKSETMSGTAPADTETEADRQAREQAAKPKSTRTVRMGERTLAAAAVARR